MFTKYNAVDDEYLPVEEADPSLTYTYASYRKWRFEERVELVKGMLAKMNPAPNLKLQQVAGHALNYLAVLHLDGESQYGGATIYASGDTIVSHAFNSVALSVTDIFSTS